MLKKALVNIGPLVGVALIVVVTTYCQKDRESQRDKIARELKRLESEYYARNGERKEFALLEWGDYLEKHQRDPNLPESAVDSARRWRMLFEEYRASK